MISYRVVLCAIFATLAVALAGCAATPLYPGYYADLDRPGAYYCGGVGAPDLGAWGGRRNCFGPIYGRHSEPELQ